MRDNRSGGPSIIRAEHLQKWLWEAQNSEEDTAAVKGATKEVDTDTEMEFKTEIETGEGGGVDAGGLPRGTDGAGIDLAGGGTTPQGGRRIIWNWPGGGGVEGGDGRYQFLPHHLHYLPRRPPWFLGRSWHWDHLP